MSNGVAIRIATPGTGVTSYEEYSDKPASEFGLSTSASGLLTFEKFDIASGRSRIAQRAGAACTDDAYTTTSQRDASYGWYLGDGAMPTGISRASVRAELRTTSTSLNDSFTDCPNLTDQLSLSVHDAGDTSTESEMDISNGETTCENYINIDNYNTLDFGNLDDHGDPPVAKTCMWWLPGGSTYVSQDIRFNVVDYTFTLSPNVSSCYNKYDLRSVAIHEFGHAVGMGHVSEENHEYLTMSTKTSPCTAHARTLGLGDVLGLRTKY